MLEIQAGVVPGLFITESRRTAFPGAREASSQATTWSQTTVALERGTRVMDITIEERRLESATTPLFLLTPVRSPVALVKARISTSSPTSDTIRSAITTVGVVVFRTTTPCCVIVDEAENENQCGLLRGTQTVARPHIRHHVISRTRPTFPRIQMAPSLLGPLVTARKTTHTLMADLART